MRVQRIILILVITVALAGAAGGYYVWHNDHPAAPKPHEVSVGVESNQAITRARSLAGEKKYTEAIAALEAVRSKTPYDQDKYDLAMAEGVIYSQAKDSVRARDVFEAAVKVKGDSLPAQYNLALAARQIADFNTATSALATAAKLLTANDSDMKARIAREQALIPTLQARVSEYDGEFVRLLGRYSWYELYQDKASAADEYQPVTKWVSDHGTSINDVNSAHAKVIQLIVAGLSSKS